MAICINERCGRHFNRLLAESMIDSTYGSGKYDWACNFAGGSICEECANSILEMDPQLDEDGEEYEVNPEDIVYPDY